MILTATEANGSKIQDIAAQAGKLTLSPKWSRNISRYVTEDSGYHTPSKDNETK